MDSSTPPQPRWFVSVILISFILGGLGGGLVSALVTGTDFGSWWGRVVGTNTTGSSISQQLNVTEDSATTAVVATAQAAVVSVIGKQDLSTLRESQFNLFFGAPPEGEQRVSGGSGFIIREDGLILTNKHVVNQEGVEYSVILHDGTEYGATIVALDPTNDLAFLDIDGSDLPTLPLGDSVDLKVGQTVIAIGNALGQYENSVTRGIISGLNRTLEAGDGAFTETLEDTIQTDAAINFGNSGGPLLNLAGQVVGVNTAIAARGQTIGFAIPINQATTDVDSIEKTGEIVRPFLGIRYALVTKQSQQVNDLPVDYGALIVRGSSPDQLAVQPGSPADQAGLEENDIILEINGQRITEDRSLSRILADYKPGDTVTLKVLHDGTERTVAVTLVKREA